MSEQEVALHGLDCAMASFRPKYSSKSRYAKLVEQSRQLPRPSEKRLKESLNDKPTDAIQIRNGHAKEEKTYLYLGYGSNMCALTFLERRGIRPIAQVNVVVPSIQLSFDLPGIPYTEPCFGNIRYRSLENGGGPPQEKNRATVPDYHKNHWHKGLVGVVYEVTASDFAHILATEGGGAAYQDVLVDCYTLSSDPSEPVPLHPMSTQLKAHTLFDPGRKTRSDPSYAQPSARYLKLITDGGEEHNLPTEYRAYLSQIRPYTLSSTAQRLGQFIFMSVWGPLLLFLFSGGGKIFLRPDGTYPPWYARMVLACFGALWDSYDNWFKPMFGDGERSLIDGGSAPDQGSVSEKTDYGNKWEKTPLLGNEEKRHNWSEPGTRYGDEMV